jgi:DNA-binding transcriptional regulator LsrR (DeoR family)
MDTKDRDLLVEVAVLYYLENKTQSEISKELFMSRPKVSRLLKKAKEMNIVEIKINYESDSLNRMSKQAQHRFGIENVVVVKTLKDEMETIREIGKQAASEMKYYLNDGIKIGMSWGRTVKAMVDNFKHKSFKDIKIVELFGAVQYSDETEEFLSIGYDFSQKVKGTYYPLPAPLFINDSTTRDVLLQSPVIKNTLNMIENCDFIVTSIGVVNSKLPQRIWDAHIDPKTREELLGLGAEGYLCAHFFNSQGQFIQHPINDNIVGIKTNDIKANKIMLIAGGLDKASAIHSIIKGGFIHTLVTDDKTLRKILQKDRIERGDHV